MKILKESECRPELREYDYDYICANWISDPQLFSQVDIGAPLIYKDGPVFVQIGVNLFPRQKVEIFSRISLIDLKENFGLK